MPLSPFSYYYPLDPDCTERSDVDDFYSDPMTQHYGMASEMGPRVEASHRKNCKRCRLYGLSNVEVIGP